MAAYKLTWAAPSIGGSASISGYDVLYTPAGGSQTVVQTGSSATTYTVTGLTDGVLYSFQVRVSGGSVSAPLSSVVLSHDPPAQVSGLSVTATGNGTIDLAWSAPSSSLSITDYSVEYTPSGGSASTVLVGSATTSYQLTGLVNGTQYSVRVAAVSPAGTGSYSTAVNATPAAPTTAVLLNYNNSLVDSGPNGYTITSGSSASFDAVNKQFGSHSRAFVPSDGDYNSGPHWKTLLTGDFTVEMFWRMNSGVLNNTVYQGASWGVFDNAGSYYDGCALLVDAYSSNYVGFYWDNGQGYSRYMWSTTPLIDNGTFRHIAIVREATEFRLYYDGSLIASNTNASNNVPLVSTIHDMKIGVDPGMMGYDGMDGNIDDFRVSSAALYSGPTYTIPTAELT